jgi:hypothetical protein
VNQSGNVGATGDLTTQVIRQHKAHKAVSIKTPFGRAVLTNDKGSGITLGSDQFASSLQAVHFTPDGKVKDIYDLGSGAVTNSGVNLLANDFTWTTATLKRMNFHRIGTGATAEVASDVFTQTPIAAGSLTGSTNGYMTGVQTYVSPNKYQSVATFTAAAGLAVTEWSLHMDNAATLSRTCGCRSDEQHLHRYRCDLCNRWCGLQQYTIEIASSVINTPTTTVMGQVLSNTATVLTIQGPSASAAWLTLANAVATTPGATVAYQVFPSAWDHKTFSVINLSSGDSLQVTYVLTCTSGG